MRDSQSLGKSVGINMNFKLQGLDKDAYMASLDKIAFLAYEGITKKKPTPKVENTIHNIGFILLMGLFVVILISDLFK